MQKIEDQNKELIQHEIDKLSNFESYVSIGEKIMKELDRIRKALPKLEINSVVLAKWSDDGIFLKANFNMQFKIHMNLLGWYYYGKVQRILDDFTYIVMDSNNYEEEISRENIIYPINNAGFEQVYAKNCD